MGEWIICDNCKSIVPHLERCDSCNHLLPNGEIRYSSDTGYEEEQEKEEIFYEEDF